MYLKILNLFIKLFSVWYVRGNTHTQKKMAGRRFAYYAFLRIGVGDALLRLCASHASRFELSALSAVTGKVCVWSTCIFFYNTTFVSSFLFLTSDLSEQRASVNVYFLLGEKSCISSFDVSNSL